MEKSNNIDKINWDLLAKYLAGEVSEVEKSAFESWINEKKENRKEFIEVKQMFEKTDLYFNMNRFDKKKGIKSVQSKTYNYAASKNKNQSIPSKKIYLSFLKYAAIAILVLAIGSIFYFIGNRDAFNLDTKQISSAKLESPKDIILPDGTIVTLNSDTKLFYPKQFEGNSREVKISGEAFFNVTPNPDKPFIINAGNTQIKVLGTSFNVYAYPGSQTVEVIVETGKVQVLNPTQTIQNTENEVFLDPGDKATFFKKEKVLTKNKNDDPNYNAWKTYNLVFEESKLSYVFQVLEKTYHVEIQTDDPEIENLMLVAEFNNKPINFVLDVIRLTFNLELSIENDRYILKNSNL